MLAHSKTILPTRITATCTLGVGIGQAIKDPSANLPKAAIRYQAAGGTMMSSMLCADESPWWVVKVDTNRIELSQLSKRFLNEASRSETSNKQQQQVLDCVQVGADEK